MPSMKKDGFVTRKIGGETVIVPICGDVGDLSAIYTLNETGSLIWQLLERPTSEAEIVDALVREYDIEAETAGADVKRFLQTLGEAGVIPEFASGGR